MRNNKEIFSKNIDRVKSLCTLYNKLKTDDVKENKNYKLTDILRSATVLLHSSFEEYFRCTLRDVLTVNYTEDTIKSLNLKSAEGKHIDKMSFVELMQHKNKTIDELIVEQINSTLNSTSFNNYSDVVRWTQKIGIDMTNYSRRDLFEKLVQRRHKIVHEADNSKLEEYQLTPIKEITVVEWIDAVNELVNIIDSQLGDNDNGDI